MKVQVVIFPGTNCDHDIVHLYSRLLGASVSTVWYRETDLGSPDLVVLPGGFSFGDYLRCGAMAKVSPIMLEVKRFAERGGRVLGVCNGFQILCEAGLLPGVLLQNTSQQFLSRFIHMRVESCASFVTQGLSVGDTISCPIAHFEGNYFIRDEEYAALEDSGQIVFRYCSPDGEVQPGNRDWNPNGSVGAIAGVSNRTGNVVGFMPHPERSAEQRVGFFAADSGRAAFSFVAESA